MHDLSKTILRRGVPLCIHKLPIYLMCTHTLFFSSIFDVISIVSACMIPLILSDSLSTSCYTQHCLQHARIAMNAAYRLAYPHNHKPHCHGVAIVQQPSWGRQSKEACRRRAFLLVIYIYIYMWQSRIEIKTYATRKFSENGLERFVTERSRNGAPCLCLPLYVCKQSLISNF